MPLIGFGAPLASDIKFRLPLRIHSTPMFLILRLAIITDAVGLSSLIECLEIEHVEAPVEDSADAGLEEGFGILGTCDRGFVAITTYMEELEC